MVLQQTLNFGIKKHFLEVQVTKIGYFNINCQSLPSSIKTSIFGVHYQNDEIWALSTNITKLSVARNIFLAVYKTLDLDWQIGFLSTGISIVFGIDS